MYLRLSKVSPRKYSLKGNSNKFRNLCTYIMNLSNTVEIKDFDKFLKDCICISNEKSENLSKITVSSSVLKHFLKKNDFSNLKNKEISYLLINLKRSYEVLSSPINETNTELSMEYELRIGLQEILSVTTIMKSVDFCNKVKIKFEELVYLAQLKFSSDFKIKEYKNLSDMLEEILLNYFDKYEPISLLLYDFDTFVNKFSMDVLKNLKYHKEFIKKEDFYITFGYYSEIALQFFMECINRSSINIEITYFFFCKYAISNIKEVMPSFFEPDYDFIQE